MFPKLKCLQYFCTRSNRIQSIIESRLKPSHFEIINESNQHSVPRGSETHFKLIIVSEQFVNKSVVQRHKDVYELLQDEMKSGLHALSMVVKSAKEWESSQVVQASPPCLGGSKHDKQPKP